MEVPSGEQLDWQARFAGAQHCFSTQQTGRSPQFAATPNMAPFAAGLPATPQGPTHPSNSFIPCGVAGNGENFGSGKWACSSLPSGMGAAGNGEHPTISKAKGHKSSPDQLDMDDLHMMSTPDLEALLRSFARKPAPWDEATARLTRWIPHVLADRQWESHTNQPVGHRSCNPQDPCPDCPQARITNWTSQTPAAAGLPSSARGTATPVVTPTSSAVSGNGEKFSSGSVPPNSGSPSPSDRWQSVLGFREELSGRLPSSHGSPVSSASGARTPTCPWPSASPDGERSRDSSLQLTNAARPGTPMSHCNSPVLNHVVSPTPSSAGSDATPVRDNRTTSAAPVPGRMVLLAHWLGGISTVPCNGTISAALGPKGGIDATPDSGGGISAPAPVPSRCIGAVPVPNEGTDATAGPVNDAPTGGAAPTPVHHKATSAVATPAPVSNRTGGSPRLKLRRLELEFRLTHHSNGQSIQRCPPSPTKGIAGTPVPAATPVAAATLAISAASVTATNPAPGSNGASGESRLTGCLHSQLIQRPMPPPAVPASALPSGNCTNGESRSCSQSTDQLNAGEPRLPAHAWSRLSDQGRALWNGFATADKLIFLSAKGAATSPDASPASSNNNTSLIATGQFQGTTHSLPAIPSETGEPSPDNRSPPLASSVTTETQEAEGAFVSSDTATVCHTIRSLLTDGEQSVPSGAQDFRQGSRCQSLTDAALHSSIQPRDKLAGQQANLPWCCRRIEWPSEHAISTNQHSCLSCTTCRSSFLQQLPAFTALLN